MGAEIKLTMVDKTQLYRFNEHTDLWFCLADSFLFDSFLFSLRQLERCGDINSVVVAGVHQSMVNYLLAQNLKRVEFYVNRGCFNIIKDIAQKQNIKLNENIKVFRSGEEIRLYNCGDMLVAITPWSYGISERYMEIEVSYRGKRWLVETESKKNEKFLGKGQFALKGRVNKLKNILNKYSKVFFALELKDFDGIKQIYKFLYEKSMALAVDMFYSDILSLMDATYPRPQVNRDVFTIASRNEYNGEIGDTRLKQFLCYKNLISPKDFITCNGIKRGGFVAQEIYNYNSQNLLKEDGAGKCKGEIDGLENNPIGVENFCYLVRRDMTTKLQKLIANLKQEDLVKSVFLYVNDGVDYTKIKKLFINKGIACISIS